MSDIISTDCPDKIFCESNWERVNCEKCKKEDFKEKLKSLRFGTVPGGYKDKNG